MLSDDQHVVPVSVAPSLGCYVREWIADDRPPVVVIVEPSADILKRWGLPDHPAGLEAYTTAIVQAAIGLVCFVKIQPAAFERFGPAGWVALQHCIWLLRSSGVRVVLDFKRADHAPVLRDIVRTYVGSDSTYYADGISVLPYLGIGEIIATAPAVADRNGLLLAIVQTSNASAGEVQRALAPSGRPVAAAFGAQITEHNRAAGRDDIGVVLGGDPETVAVLLRSHYGIAVIPGWGRPGTDRAGMRDARAVAPEQVLFSMGSFLTRQGPGIANLRSVLQREAAIMG